MCSPSTALNVYCTLVTRVFSYSMLSFLVHFAVCSFYIVVKLLVTDSEHYISFIRPCGSLLIGFNSSQNIINHVHCIECMALCRCRYTIVTEYLLHTMIQGLYHVANCYSLGGMYTSDQWYSGRYVLAVLSLVTCYLLEYYTLQNPLCRLTLTLIPTVKSLCLLCRPL